MAKITLLQLAFSSESIQNVTLSTQPESAEEGADRFTLKYSLLQGVVEYHKWFFNGREIETGLHYSVEQRSLVIHGPNRSDTGQYTVLLTNPFSSVTALRNVAVLCKSVTTSMFLQKHFLFSPSLVVHRWTG